MVKVFFIFLFVTAALDFLAQDTITENFEQKSYQLYLEKKWPTLISYGKMAIAKGHDYFYMQMRVGIAYYEKKNYSLAESYFKNALKLNSGDELAKEYLYYCYLFNGRFDDARMLSKTFSDSLSKKTGINMSTSVTGIVIETGTKISDSSSYYDKTKKNSSYFFNPPVYFQIGLGHHIKNRASLFHAFTYFNQQTYIGNVKQIQYFLKGTIPFKNNWLFSPALHLINLNVASEVQSPPPRPGRPPLSQTVISTSNYFVGSFAVQKIIKKVNLSVGSTVLNMSGNIQYIHSGFASYSVFGNARLILGCTGYLHTSDSYSTLYASANPFIYIQPINRFSIKAGYFVNSGNNIVEDNGYFVNNSLDFTNSRFSFTANFTVSKHLTLYGLYQLENKTESTQQFKYRYNVFVGGIKITP
jgi:tetratricopeptide (TPR) repeat protein